jgi:hypothetical protein
MERRVLLAGLAALAASPVFAQKLSAGERLAQAARAQVGVTTGYDPTWTAIQYPNGDVPRSTGVCADVVVRAARDGLGLDLQQLVHEDMAKHFSEYPARKAWGAKGTDANIDHRRVLNLEAYFTRVGARIWTATGTVAGNDFPQPLAVGDTVTWLLDARLPHIGVVVATAGANSKAHVVHNIGRGAEESLLAEFAAHRAVGHYRWPVRG